MISFTILLYLLIFSIRSSISSREKNLPVVLWHGMGDSCCFSWSMGNVKKEIIKNKPNIYIKSLKIGSFIATDVWNSFFMNPNKQVEYACKMIQEDNALRNGYNAIGFSQGALFMRAVAQRCPTPPMRTFISMGGPHQGTFSPLFCRNTQHKWCQSIRKMVSFVTESRIFRKSFTSIHYWHNPFDAGRELYKKTFLADINNEIIMTPQYKNNLIKLHKMVLVKFEKDELVIPQMSSWFGYYAPGQDKQVLKMENTALYKEDRIGLQLLKKAGKIDFLSIDTSHMEFADEWFGNRIVKPYL